MLRSLRSDLRSLFLFSNQVVEVPFARLLEGRGKGPLNGNHPRPEDQAGGGYQGLTFHILGGDVAWEGARGVPGPARLKVHGTNCSYIRCYDANAVRVSDARD